MTEEEVGQKIRLYTKRLLDVERLLFNQDKNQIYCEQGCPSPAWESYYRADSGHISCPTHRDHINGSLAGVCRAESHRRVQVWWERGALKVAGW